MNNDKLFLNDSLTGTNKSYSDLLNDLKAVSELSLYCYEKNIYSVFLVIIASLLKDEPIVLLDNDFSAQELAHLGIMNDHLNRRKEITISGLHDINDFISKLHRRNNWTISLYTSGTTGLPKLVKHTFESITRTVKKDENKASDVWGFAYNPTHIAGLQVFFQALLNGNTIVNTFQIDKDKIVELIETYSITNISATPTYYRMLFPSDKTLSSVKRITSGGEKFDTKLTAQLKITFPNAKILNIYASTEAGTVLAANGDIFSIKESEKDKIKIESDELLIHKSLLGKSDLLQGEDEWYRSGDVVELINTNPLTFRILNRKNEMINVGGYKVNPLEVEEILNSHIKVKASVVYAKKSSVTGNILMCDLETNDSSLTEEELTNYLSDKLQQFKIPRIFNIVEKIELTRTGKLKRW